MVAGGPDDRTDRRAAEEMWVFYEGGSDNRIQTDSDER